METKTSESDFRRRQILPFKVDLHAVYERGECEKLKLSILDVCQNVSSPLTRKDATLWAASVMGR